MTRIQSGKEMIADKRCLKAYRLASFIHNRDEQVALTLAIKALNSLAVLSRKQEKRSYHKPKKSRYKMFLKVDHLLQRLVYEVSGGFEQAQEGSGGAVLLQKEDFIVRYLEHLVKIIFKGNHFQAAVGVCRFVYRYELAEAHEVYRVLVPNNDRHTEIDSPRKCKSSLMTEIKKRFGDLLTVEPGRRGSRDFRPEDNCHQYFLLVRQSFEEFMPWETSCVVPEHFNPRFEIPDLCFNRQDSYFGGSRVDARRLHTALHPLCFSRLTTNLGFAPPETKLAIPQFLLPGGSDSSQATRISHPFPSEMAKNSAKGSSGPRPFQREMDQTAKALMKETLLREAHCRRELDASWLSITLDGVEIATLDTHIKDNVCFEIEEAGMLEVRKKEDLLLLAVCLLDCDDFDVGYTQTYSTVLEAGQNIIFKISARTDQRNGKTSLIVNVAYQKFVKAIARSASSAIH